MGDKYIYEYCVLRLVPRVDREEFINIGVILFCKNSDFLDVKIKLDEAKAKALFSSIDIDEVQCYLDSFLLIASGDKNGGPIAVYDKASRFRWLTAKRSTVIQLSSIHSGLTESAQQTLHNLFKIIVE